MTKKKKEKKKEKCFKSTLNLRLSCKFKKKKKMALYSRLLGSQLSSAVDANIERFHVHGHNKWHRATCTARSHFPIAPLLLLGTASALERIVAMRFRIVESHNRSELWQREFVDSQENVVARFATRQWIDDDDDKTLLECVDEHPLLKHCVLRMNVVVDGDGGFDHRLTSVSGGLDRLGIVGGGGMTRAPEPSEQDRVLWHYDVKLTTVFNVVVFAENFRFQFFSLEKKNLRNRQKKMFAKLFVAIVVASALCACANAGDLKAGAARVVVEGPEDAPLGAYNHGDRRVSSWPIPKLRKYSTFLNPAQGTIGMSKKRRKQVDKRKRIANKKKKLMFSSN
jgi:hypothetical protein